MVLDQKFMCILTLKTLLKYLLHHERGLSTLGLAPPDDSSQRALLDYFSISESKIKLYVIEQSTVSDAVLPAFIRRGLQSMAAALVHTLTWVPSW
jgi:hypothetical protein